MEANHCARHYDAQALEMYEQMKREWVDSHPEATGQEYAQAMREIAEKAGI